MADRWVCRSCWASNEANWDKCLKCRTPRGAEATPLMTGAAGADGSAAAPTARPWWQRLPMQFAGVGIVVVAGIIGALNAANRDESGEIVGAGNLHITDVRVGDCFDLNDEADLEEVGEIRAIPCDEPHDFEAFHQADLAAGSYPSRSSLDASVETICIPSFESYVGRDYQTSSLYLTWFEPTPDGWDDGDRGLLCAISTEDAATPLTGSVRDSRR